MLGEADVAVQGSFVLQVDNLTAFTTPGGAVSDDLVEALVEAVADMAGVDKSLVTVVISTARRLESLEGRARLRVSYTISADGKPAADIAKRLKALEAQEAGMKVEESLRDRGIGGAVEVLNLAAPAIVSGLRTSTTFEAGTIPTEESETRSDAVFIAGLSAASAAILCLSFCLWRWSRACPLQATSDKKLQQRSCSSHSIRSRASLKSAGLSSASQPSLSSLPKAIRRSASLLGMEEGCDDFDMIVSRL